MTQMSEAARAQRRAYMQDYWERKAKGQLKRTRVRYEDPEAEMPAAFDDGDAITEMSRRGLTYEQYIQELRDENARLRKRVERLTVRNETYKQVIDALKSNEL